MEDLTSSPSDAWAIVFGGDVNLPSAQDEVKRLKRVDVGNGKVDIYLREKSYRTVISFTAKEEAEQTLPRVRTLRASAYVVNLSRWCPQATARDGHLVCE